MGMPSRHTLGWKDLGCVKKKEVEPFGTLIKIFADFDTNSPLKIFKRHM